MKLRLLLLAGMVLAALPAAPSASPKTVPMPAQDLLNHGRVDDAVAQLQERIQ